MWLERLQCKLWNLVRNLWINRVEASLIVKLVKFDKFFVHVNIGALVIWKNLSCVNGSSEDETSVFNRIFDVFNEPIKSFNIFFKILKCRFWDLHLLENLLWFSCVFVLHLTSYKSRNNQSLIDVNDIKRKVDSSWHGFNDRLLFTVELR